MDPVLRDESGAAAAEMAMVLPLLLLLLFGSVELGNYFLSEHVLVKGVRDGAVYAARNQISRYDCEGKTVELALVNGTKNLVRTGQLVGGSDLLPNWDHAQTEFQVKVDCSPIAGATTLGGIYAMNGGEVPVVKVIASLPYRPIVASLGFNTRGLQLNASQQAVVSGI